MAAAQEADRPRIDASRFIRTGEARRALRNTAVPRVSLHTVRRMQEKRRFGRWITVDKISDEESGWIVGQFPWFYIPPGQDAPVTVTHTTVLVDSDSVPQRFARVEPDAVHGGYLTLGHESLAGRDPYAPIGAAVHALLA